MTANIATRLFRGQYTLPLSALDDEINVDLFAGGGGASTGLEMGLGRPVHIAINHNPAAISMHRVNHPGALHLETDVWAVDPVQTLAGKKTGWFHASPDCTHHSQAAGGQPRQKEIRDLSWVVIKWAGIAKPRIISLENVKQIRSWGPLVAKRCKETGRVIKLDRTVAQPGERVPREQQFLVPCAKRKGQTWHRFIAELERLGYNVEHRILRACDYGAPTSRERLFLVARRDDQPIIWPKPSHAEKPAKGQQPYRTAAECIDWSIPSQSIFTRKRPLADATLRRIAKGIHKEVLTKAQPFIVPVTHQGADRMHSLSDPLRTVTAANRGELALATPVLCGVGGRAGQSQPRAGDRPASTITAKADTALVTAFLAQANGGFNVTHSKPMVEPMSTVTNTGSQQQLVTANLLHLRGNCDGRAMDDPLHTISAGGQHHGVVAAFLSSYYTDTSNRCRSLNDPVATITTENRLALVECTLSREAEQGALRCAAFLMKYYSEGGQWQGLDQPMDTLTTKDRLALVTVWIGGDPYVIVDICLRMLQPPELYAAQGFPPNYIITHGHDGRRFTKSQQVHMCGNSVSPPPMAAIAAANNPWRAEQSVTREAA